MATQKQQKADPEATGEDKVQAAQEAAEVSPPEPEVQASGQGSDSFTVSRLIAEAPAFLNVPGHVVAGALAGEDRDAEFTLTQVRKRIESWSKAPQGPGE